MDELINKMEEVIKYAKEANDALEFSMRRLNSSNKELANIMKELVDAKKN